MTFHGFYTLKDQIEDYGLDKLFLGFENFFNELDNFGACSSYNSAYPHYNLAKRDDRYVIEIAVAGFEEDDISVELDGSVLVVKGNKPTKEDEDQNETLSEYIHQGVAGRSFTRKFRVGSDVTADQILPVLKNGILTIDILKKEQAEPVSIKVSGG